MPIVDARDGFFYPSLTFMMYSNLSLVKGLDTEDRHMALQGLSSKKNGGCGGFFFLNHSDTRIAISVLIVLCGFFSFKFQQNIL